MLAYYNEIDPYCIAWLRELMDRGLIAPGFIDTRSIEEVRPRDVARFTQCHFFAGLGGWPLALRLAGWADERPVWTGSCPCQPFSAIGQRRGTLDERHLWPVWRRLIGQCQPSVVFGEQVASADGLQWLDSVRADVEAEGYAVGTADLCAASVGAPNVRQRLWFTALRLGHSDCKGLEGLGSHPGAGGWEKPGGPAASAGRPVLLAGRSASWAAPPDSVWGDVDWLLGRDGAWRPVEPGAFPLAPGHPGRVDRLRALGNSLNPWVGKVFIEEIKRVLD